MRASVSYGHISSLLFVDTYFSTYCFSIFILVFRLCKNVKLIQDAAKGIGESSRFHRVSVLAKRMTSRLDEYKKGKEQNIQTLAKSHDNIVAQVEQQYESLDRCLRKMRQETLDELNAIHETLRTQLLGENEECSVLCNELLSLQELLENKRDKHDVKKLAELIKCQQKLTVAENFFKGSLNQSISVLYDRNTALNEIVHQVTSLGDIKVDMPKPQHVYTVASFQSLNIRCKEDTGNCDVTGIQRLSDGMLLMSDYGNKCLKLFDEQLNSVIDRKDAGSLPYGIAALSDSEFAVVVVSGDCASDVCFIAIQNMQIKKKRNFKIEQFCTGIAVHGDELYIKSGAGIYIYSKLGKFLDHFWQGRSTFGYLAVSQDGEKVYVCNPSSLVTLDKFGIELNVLNQKELSIPWGMFVAGNGNVFLCATEANTVMQIDSEGKTILSVISTEFGVVKPKSVFFDSGFIRLYVGQKSDNVLVFQMK